MKIGPIYLAVLLALLLSSVTAGAENQKMERPKDREPGDKATFRYVVNNKTLLLEEIMTSLTDDEMAGIHKVDGKEFEIVMGKSPSFFQLRKALCFPNGQQVCRYSPGLNLVEFPLEKGKKWTTPYVVTGETFTAEGSQERTVERIESLRVPAGEFETYKITYTGHVKSRDKKGDVYTAKEWGTDWFALVSGKLITVKVAYKNSFGEQFSLELISSSFK